MTFHLLCYVVDFELDDHQKTLGDKPAYGWQAHS